MKHALLLVLSAAFAVAAQTSQQTNRGYLNGAFVRDGHPPRCAQGESPTAPNKKFLGLDFLTVLDLVLANRNDLAQSDDESDTQYIERADKVLRQIKIPRSDLTLADTFFAFGNTASYETDKQAFSLMLPKYVEGGSRGTLILDLLEKSPRFSASRLGATKWNLPLIPMELKKANLVKDQVFLGIYGKPATTDGQSLGLIPTKFIAFNDATCEVYFEVEAETLLSNHEGQ